MTYDQWKLAEPDYYSYEYEPDEQPERCELCELEATESVDLEPVRWPGRFVARLCSCCAAFERHRINEENGFNQ